MLAVAVEERSHTASALKANHKEFNSSSNALSVAVSAAANAAWLREAKAPSTFSPWVRIMLTNVKKEASKKK